MPANSLFISAVTLLAAAGVLSAPVPGPRRLAAPTPVVVELFTSEGCSSCPAADAVLRELERTQPVAGAEIIGLGEHVDYWNRLGWRDPFSARAYTERQRDYAGHFGSGSYTPQAVVQGRTELVGSRRTELLAAIGAAAKSQQATVALGGGSAGQPLQVRVSELPAGTGPARVLLFFTESGLSTQVGAGENAGHLLQHAAVVRHLQALGTVAEAATLTTEATVPGPHLSAVVVVQAERSGRIVGARRLAL